MTCFYCKKEIPDTAARLKVDGTIDWTAAPHGLADVNERVLSGAAEFCSIRCLGTLIGVTLESRSLIPPRKK